MFVRAEQGIHVTAVGCRQGQAEPVHAVHQHAQPGAQVTRHHIHQAHLPAMAVEQHQSLDATGGHAFTDLGPKPDYCFRFECQRTGKLCMLRAEAHSLGRQKQSRYLGRDVWQGMGNHTIHQGAVHLQGQMRAVLFRGCHGQHGNQAIERACCAGLVELRAGPVSPEAGRCLHGCILPRAVGLLRLTGPCRSRRRKQSPVL